MEITKVVKPLIKRGWPNTFANIVYVLLVHFYSLIMCTIMLLQTIQFKLLGKTF